MNEKNLKNKLNDDLVDFYSLYEKDNNFPNVDNYLNLIQQDLDALYKNTNKTNSNYLYRTCIIIYNSLSGIDKNNFTMNKMKVLRDVIYEVIVDKEVTKEAFYKVDSLLVDNDMDWINCH